MRLFSVHSASNFRALFIGTAAVVCRYVMRYFCTDNGPIPINRNLVGGKLEAENESIQGSLTLLLSSTTSYALQNQSTRPFSKSSA